jgi:predicted DNA binding protein
MKAITHLMAITVCLLSTAIINTVPLRVRNDTSYHIRVALQRPNGDQIVTVNVDLAPKATSRATAMESNRLSRIQVSQITSQNKISAPNEINSNTTHAITEAIYNNNDTWAPAGKVPAISITYSYWSGWNAQLIWITP